MRERERENKRGFGTALSSAKDNLEHLDVLPRPKAARVHKRREPAVTVYVRKVRCVKFVQIYMNEFVEVKILITVKRGNIKH